MLLLQRYRGFFFPNLRNKIKNEANILQIITGIRFD